ncbi:hypothetical protein [Pseudonocardia nigra]|uniref:hypothetical protein n=1 Tax=Pseudonocardia nigra TaxID=1921578 RepID=UPI001C5DFF05|nr:hypothetical protein [Pseudonocardia nigra]
MTSAVSVASGLNTIQAIGIFGGIPLLIFGLIALAVYIPERRKQARLRAELQRRRARATSSESGRESAPDDRSQPGPGAEGGSGEGGDASRVLDR